MFPTAGERFSQGAHTLECRELSALVVASMILIMSSNTEFCFCYFLPNALSVSMFTHGTAVSVMDEDVETAE